jgi:hypothetical protein
VRAAPARGQLGHDDLVHERAVERLPEDVGVADLVRAATVVVSQGALDNLTARARKEAKA